MIRILFIFFVTVQLTFAFDPLINKQATKEATDLFNRMAQNYGKRIYSGQTNFHFSDLVNKVGRNPVIQAFDMQNYSPHNPWYNWQPYDDGTVSSALQWYEKTNKKGIVSFHWHWFSPMGGSLRTSTFYTNYTNFDVKKAVT